jgi:hypothetical protein
MKIENAKVARRLTEDLSQIELAERLLKSHKYVNSYLELDLSGCSDFSITIDEEYKDKVMEFIGNYKEWLIKRLEEL